MAWHKNLGSCPPHAKGKRVRVRLKNGLRPPESWPADERGGCRWTLTGHPFDIAEFEVIQ